MLRPATDSTEALVEAFLTWQGRREVWHRHDGRRDDIRDRLDAIVAAARADIDVERLERVMAFHHDERWANGQGMTHCTRHCTDAIAAAYREAER